MVERPENVAKIAELLRDFGIHKGHPEKREAMARSVSAEGVFFDTLAIVAGDIRDRAKDRHEAARLLMSTLKNQRHVMEGIAADVKHDEEIWDRGKRKTTADRDPTGHLEKERQESWSRHMAQVPSKQAAEWARDDLEHVIVSRAMNDHHPVCLLARFYKLPEEEITKIIHARENGIGEARGWMEAVVERYWSHWYKPVDLEA